MPAYLLDKGTTAAIYHENIGRFPGFHFPIFIVTDRVPFGSINIWVAQVRLSIVNVLSNRASVRRHSEQGLAVIISSFPEQTVGDLLIVSCVVAHQQQKFQ